MEWTGLDMVVTMAQKWTGRHTMFASFFLEILLGGVLFDLKACL
jgi:hypothetical protein